MSRSFKLFDLELAPYVVDWGEIEEIKEVLLSESQLFVGEHQIVLNNQDSRFSPANPASPFYGRNIQNVVGLLDSNENALFKGFVKDLQLDYHEGTCTVVMENAFTQPTDALLVHTDASPVNPVSVMVAILQSAGVGAYLDLGSFSAAAGPSLAAGAVVTTLFSSGSNVSVLSAIQALGQLASVSVFVSDGIIRARAFTPYSGDNSGLRFPIDASTVRNFSQANKAYDNFRNSVTVQYGGSSLFVSLKNNMAIRKQGIERSFQFSTANGNQVAVPDANSALFFATTFLQRAAPLRDVITLDGGPELQSVNIGDRHPITAPRWGWNGAPFEVIETHQHINENGVSLTLASLA
jgi:hypothetical protein